MGKDHARKVCLETDFSREETKAGSRCRGSDSLLRLTAVSPKNSEGGRGTIGRRHHHHRLMGGPGALHETSIFLVHRSFVSFISFSVAPRARPERTPT